MHIWSNFILVEKLLSILLNREKRTTIYSLWTKQLKYSKPSELQTNQQYFDKSFSWMRKMKKSRARRLYYCLLKHYCCCFQMHCDSGNIRISIVLSPPRCLCLVLRHIRNILRIYIYRSTTSIFIGKYSTLDRSILCVLISFLATRSPFYS